MIILGFFNWTKKLVPCHVNCSQKMTGLFVNFQLFLLIFILIVQLSFADNTENDDDHTQRTLKFVQIIFRHGDREPDTKFSGGVGSLTNLGKRQMFNLGLKIRETYHDNLIGKMEFDPSQILIVSSDKDRTIQSASTFGYGLYQDFNMAATWNQIGDDDNKKISFEPIPVHTIPSKYDHVIQVTAPCPRLDELYDAATKMTGENLAKNHQNLLNYYRENKKNDPSMPFWGETINEPSWYNQMILEQERFLFNKTHNLPIPKWIETLFEEDVYTGLKSRLSRNAMRNYPEYRKLFSGSLVQLLVDNFNEKIINDENNQRKLILYCGHDRTIFYLLIALNLDDTSVLTLPPSGAALMIELHQEKRETEPFLKFWYRNDTDSGYNGKPQLLEIPNCPHPCNFNTFVKLTKSLIPTDLEQECEKEAENEELI